MNISDRIIQYLEYKGVSKNQFYITTGLSNGFLDKKPNIGADKIERIIYIYKDLNLTWLITGEGEMLKNELKKEEKKLEELHQSQPQSGLTDYLEKQNKEKDLKIESLNRRIWELEKEVSELSTRLQKYGIHNSTVSELIIEKK